MKFGKVASVENIDFRLPKDHPESLFTEDSDLTVYVGCAKWNKADLKNFYPKGTKDELVYYASQFNSIELNATFYRLFGEDQYHKWYEKTPADFRFFPKVNQEISHFKRLKNAELIVQEYIKGVEGLKEKLGECFLQLHDNFSPKDFDTLKIFCSNWPKHIPLAVELRHTSWYNDATVSNELFHLLEENNMSNIITDTAGRRDLLHMRLTNNNAFIRFVGANHDEIDYKRLDDWLARLVSWKGKVSNIYFFVHQNVEEKSPVLSAYFIDRLNKKLKTKLRIPHTNAPTLF